MKVAAYRFCCTAVLSLWSAILVPAATAQQKAELEWTVKDLAVPIRVEMTVPEDSSCASTVEVSYAQRDTFANVETSIENTTCDASHGTYELTLSVRDASGQRQSLRIQESWERPESGILVFSRDYPIGENTDLLSARVGRLRCACSGDVEQQSQGDPEAPAN